MLLRLKPVLIPALMLCLSACGGGGGSSPSPDPGPTNNNPEFTSGTAVASPENQSSTGYTAAASDPDGDALTFSIAGGDDQSLLSIDSGDGVLTFDAPPDFEAPSDADAGNDYEVILQAEDGNGGSAEQTVVVSVTDVSQLSFAVSYPTPNANIGNEAQTTVAGSIQDQEDGEVRFDDVDFIDVNGVLATFDASDPALWSAQVCRLMTLK